MSKVLNAINRFYFRQGLSEFYVPACDFTEEDMPLVKAGIFTLSEKELPSLFCPFGCGELEKIHRLEKADGSIGRYVFCYDNGEFELEPKDYQLYKFNASAFLLSGKELKALLQGRNEPMEKPKKRQGPRNTAFMDFQRKTTIAYVVEKCHRSLSTLTLADCRHVWNLPIHKATWDKRAKMKNDLRGYSGYKVVFQSIKIDKQATK